MAELLIYNTTHWMDLLKEDRWKELESACPSWAERYARRSVRGDVIEVRPDGYWTGGKAKGYDRSVFRVVCVTDVTSTSAVYLANRNSVGARRYSITITAGTEPVSARLAELAIVDKGA